MARGSVEDKDLEQFVFSNVEYIRKFIYKFKNRDRAYYEWVFDKIPWLRHRLKRDEINLLDNLIINS